MKGAKKKVSMQKRGVKLNASRIGKDDDGFEDLDQFWDAAGEFKSPNKCPSSPPARACSMPLTIAFPANTQTQTPRFAQALLPVASRTPIH